MNAEKHSTLITCIKEFGDSLIRAEAEKELQKAIADRVETELDVKPTHFKKAAMAYFKDKVKDVREDMAEQLDLLDSISLT
jgi:hypothetical protein